MDYKKLMAILYGLSFTRG